VFEAKANGADLILLICEALSKNQINELTNAAVECGLEVLLELHSKEQIDKINFKENKIIGVNNRNLKTFEVDLNTTALLSKYIDDDLILVSESGISKKEDLDFLKSFEIDAILVGELLMRSVKFKSKIHELKSWCVKSNGEL
jgi:indole-3-glycerol phosphate synthase